MGGRRTATVALVSGLALVATACMHEVAPLGAQAWFAGGHIVINDRSTVAGMTVNETGMPHAFIKIGDEPVKPLDGGTAFASSVAGINEDNVVAGTIGATKPGEGGGMSGHPFRWSPGEGLQELPLPEGMFGAAAIDINAGGTILVAGFPDMWAEQSKPFLWNPGTGYTPVPARDLYSDKPAAINDDGILVGQAVFRSGEGQQAAWWDATPAHALHEMDDGGAQFSSATDISPSGRIAGSAYVPGTGQRVTYWSAVGAQPTLFEGEVANAVNDKGVMAGYIRLPAENYRLTAVLWDTTKGTTVRLGDYSSGGSQAHDVNMGGVAVGMASDASSAKYNVVRWDEYKPGP